jgi:UDP-glucuronate decarboxylase
MHPADGRAVSNFIMQALAQQPITLYGDGSQTRAFCYVDDMIEAFIRLMDYEDGGNRVGPINLGSPLEVSILSIANQVVHFMGSTSQVIFEPLPGDDPRRRCPDIAAAKALLDWVPTVSLEAGLRKTIEYFKGLSL